MFNREKQEAERNVVNRNLHSGCLMTLNFVPARYARVQPKGSMCSPRGHCLCGGTKN